MSKRVLIIGLVWPEPTSSAAGWRMMELINTFLKKGYRLHFACAANKSESSFDLSSIDVTEHHIKLNDETFDHFVKTLSPQIVLFDRFMIEEQYSWRVREHCPNALLILDTEDLHCVRFARQKAYKENIPFSEELLYNQMSKREVASILRMDISIIISKYEMELLGRLFRVNECLLVYLPFLVGQETPISNPFVNRANFVFIGNFIHQPNWHATLELKKLWPEIRQKIPNSEIHVYGAYPSQKVWELNKPKEGFIIKGKAEDAIDTLKHYRLLLAPLPYGAGIKGKFLDALRAGTPAVTNEIGAEAIADQQQWSGYISNSSEDFIENAVDLYQNEQRWNIAAENGKSLLKSLYSQSIYEDFFDRLQAISDNIETHRKQNLMGEILWTNQYNSAKYMSLWIQQKNNS